VAANGPIVGVCHLGLKIITREDANTAMVEKPRSPTLLVISYTIVYYVIILFLYTYAIKCIYVLLSDIESLLNYSM